MWKRKWVEKCIIERMKHFEDDNVGREVHHKPINRLQKEKSQFQIRLTNPMKLILKEKPTPDLFLFSK
ncbi:hypothetical protein C1N55_13915 [Lysinibacillus sp. SGAir0095]|nr:hypothetical protein C1N55_13915 [Lysinibacillus sp. SGAir0095]